MRLYPLLSDEQVIWQPTQSCQNGLLKHIMGLASAELQAVAELLKNQESALFYFLSSPPSDETNRQRIVKEKCYSLGPVNKILEKAAVNQRRIEAGPPTDETTLLLTNSVFNGGNNGASGDLRYRRGSHLNC